MLSGEVNITLNGVSATLSPTLGAALRLNTMHGSLGALIGKLEAYDLKAAADTVHFGLGRSDDQIKRTTEEVFSSGLVDLVPDLISYVIRLANGGKPLKAEEEDKATDGPFDG